MAGVLELIRGPQPQRRLLGVSQRRLPGWTRRFWSFWPPKEILAEVFGMKISEVEEMLRQRTEEVEEPCQKEEGGLWPESFRLVK
jgi:hypothetical protein